MFILLQFILDRGFSVIIMFIAHFLTALTFENAMHLTAKRLFLSFLFALTAACPLILANFQQIGAYSQSS